MLEIRHSKYAWFEIHCEAVDFAGVVDLFGRVENIGIALYRHAGAVNLQQLPRTTQRQETTLEGFAECQSVSVLASEWFIAKQKRIVGNIFHPDWKWLNVPYAHKQIICVSIL